MKTIQFCCISILLLTAGYLRAASYTITDLGTLGGDYCYASGINDSGQIVVNSSIAGGDQHAFLYDGGTMTDLGTLGGDYCSASGINNSGQIVGSSSTSGGDQHAFLYDGGTMTDLGALDGDDTSSASGINDSGQVAGTSWSSINWLQDVFIYDSISGMTELDMPASWSICHGINNSGQVIGQYSAGHAFLYDDGAMTDLGTLDGDFLSDAFGINDSGQVVGFSYTYTVEEGTLGHAFLYDDGAMTDLGTLGGSNSYAWGINNSGQIVGYSFTSGGDQHAFLYDGSFMFDLNELLIGDISDWTINNAYDINSLGQIVGYGSINDEMHAVLLTPVTVPAPGAILLGILGLGAVGMKLRKLA